MATLGGAIWAWVRPPMRVRVGWDLTDAILPLHYHLSAFPAFGAMVAGVAWAFWDRRASRVDQARGALLAACSVVAVARLGAGIPLSGHAVFLSAAVVFEALLARAERAPWVGWLAAAGLLVTAWYKLFVWADTAWFLGSVATGVGIGAAALRWRKAGGRAR